MHAGPAPSPWVLRFAGCIRRGGSVLDVACGSGRHFRWLAAQGFAVTGVDRDAAAVAPLTTLGEVLVADLEGGPWPLTGRRFDAVVMTNYLWRPLWPDLLASLADEGVLIVETFARGQETIGRPSRSEFLLETGELLARCHTLRVLAFEDGFEPEPAPGRFVQRIAAARTAEPVARRWRLAAGAAGAPG